MGKFCLSESDDPVDVSVTGEWFTATGVPYLDLKIRGRGYPRNDQLYLDVTEVRQLVDLVNNIPVTKRPPFGFVDSLV